MKKLTALAALVFLPLSAVAACITDDTGVEVCLDAPPARAVSLYGAFTESIAALGSADTIVARTANDTTIAELSDLPVVGSGLRPDVEYLMALGADVIIARGSKAAGAALESMRSRGLKVAAFEPTTVGETLGVISRLGTLWGREAEAAALVDSIREELSYVAEKIKGAGRRPGVAFEVRAEPLTVAGAEGLVDELITAAGGDNVFDHPKKLVRLDVEALLVAAPDYYLIQEGPMNKNPPPPDQRPFHSKLEAVRQGRVHLVDEKLISRPGPNMGKAALELSRLILPEVWEDEESSP